jgi:hypothetical protein
MRNKICRIILISVTAFFNYHCSSAFKDGYDELTEKVAVVSTIAGGNGPGYLDGNRSTAQFYYISSLTYYNNTLYIFDNYDVSDHRIRRLHLSTNVVDLLAEYPTTNYMTSLTCYANNGFLYIGDFYGIKKINLSNNELSLVAGNPTTFGYVNTPFSNATFDGIHALAIIGSDIFAADFGNDAIRRVHIEDCNDSVSTFAGPLPESPSNGFVDGIGSTAQFYGPSGLTYDETYLYVCDRQNNAIRRIEITTQKVETIAGPPPTVSLPSGFVDGIGPAARFHFPCGITKIGNNLYVADFLNNAIRRINLSTFEVTTVIGKGSQNIGFKDGPASEALLFWPTAITTDGTSLYFSDANKAVRKISFIPKGQIQ